MNDDDDDVTNKQKRALSMLVELLIFFNSLKDLDFYL